MPKLEIKTLYRDLDNEWIWPFYWLYGLESMKIRECLKKIKKTIFQNEGSGTVPGSEHWNIEIIDGSDSPSCSAILDSCRTLSFSSGKKLVIVRNAQLLKKQEILSQLMGPIQKLTQASSVCVCISKNLDGRKSFSKTLLEKTAVIPCEEILDPQKEKWIQFLAKRRNLLLSSTVVMQLRLLEPWTLDQVDQELEKAFLSTTPILPSSDRSHSIDPQSPTQEVYCETLELGSRHNPDQALFLNYFFTRNKNQGLAQVYQWANQSDQILPLLGLISWYVRQLSIFIFQKANQTHPLFFNAHTEDSLKTWSPYWSLEELVTLQEKLTEMDLKMKQTCVSLLGLWVSLIINFGRNSQK